ncbi:hypothetical protein WG922_09865 [Ramlibacter sp. AN1015]|uniref:hypothetical protein n=1 Tax=Ramlibacter sp. AN1015 TaxID=3133428 RepID=UPI0030BC45E8
MQNVAKKWWELWSQSPESNPAFTTDWPPMDAVRPHPSQTLDSAAVLEAPGWPQPTEPAQAADPRIEPQAADNVIYPEGIPAWDRQPAPQAHAGSTGTTGTTSSTGGTLEPPQLEAFLHENHFAIGRHHGAQLRTRDALQLGKTELVSRFRNLLELLVRQSRSKLARLQDKQLEVEGVCDATSARLRAACDYVRQEIATYQQQGELAASHAGWVSEPLTRYEMGFRRGLAEATDFDALMRS